MHRKKEGGVCLKRKVDISPIDHSGGAHSEQIERKKEAETKQKEKEEGRKAPARREVVWQT